MHITHIKDKIIRYLNCVKQYATNNSAPPYLKMHNNIHSTNPSTRSQEANEISKDKIVNTTRK